MSGTDTLPHSAIFEDEYDGAPDSNCPVGFGKTKAEAIADLLDRDFDKRDATNPAMTPLDFPTFAACPNCGGDKGFESEPWGMDRYNGSPLTDWIPCEFCDATGEVETQSAGEEWLDEE